MNKTISKLFLGVFLIFFMGSVFAAITNITVTSPIENDIWSGTQAITWTATGCTGDENVEIWWTKGSPVSSSEQIVDDLNCALYTYNWNTEGRTDGADYQVFVKAKAGSLYTGYSDGLFELDNTHPTLTITIDDNELNVGDTALVIFTFSEAPTGFIKGDVTVANGTIGDINSDNPLVQTATLTPTDNIEDLSNLITVAKESWTDDALNQPAEDSNSPNYGIDTKEPTVVITATQSDPTKESPIQVTATFSEAVTTFVEGDIDVVNGTIDVNSFTATSTTVYDFNITPAGQLTVTVDINASKAIDAYNNNNEAATQFSIRYDTVAPTVAITMDDYALNVGDTALVTFTFSEAPASGTFTVADVNVEDANGIVGAVSATGDPLVFTATFTPTDDIEDATNTIITGTSWTDAALNAPTDGNTSSNYTIDTIEPVISTVTSNATNAGVLKIGDTILFTADISVTEAGLTILPTTYNGGTLTWSTANGGDTYTATYTVVEGHTDRTSALQLTGVTATDAAGNASAAVSGSDVVKTIDATKPTVVSATVGSTPKTAGVVTVTVVFSETMDTTTTPTVTVTGLTTAPYTVTQSSYDTNTWIGTFILVDNDESATATITVSGAKDAALNTMVANNTAGTFTVDTLAPTVSQINFDKSGYRLTQDANVIVTIVEDNTSASLTVNGQTATESPAGTWTHEFAHGKVAVGTYSVLIVATDTAGNAAQHFGYYSVIANTDATAPTVGDVNYLVGCDYLIVSAEIDDDSNGYLFVWQEYNIAGEDDTTVSDTIRLLPGTITLLSDVLESETDYNYSLFVEDNAGNINEFSHDFTTEACAAPTTYQFEFPANGLTFTAEREEGWFSLNRFEAMDIWDENLLMEDFLNSDAGLEDEQLVSTDVFTVYIYNDANGWMTVDSTGFNRRKWKSI